MPSSSRLVHGVDLDSQTRCLHYHTALDIVAIKMRCCGLFYACKDCHDALAGHPLQPWPCSEWHEHAILCGACQRTLSISAYLACSSQCPHCHASFNPACRNHYHFYFARATP